MEKALNSRDKASGRRANDFARVSRSEWRAFAILTAISLAIWLSIALTIDRGTF